MRAEIVAVGTEILLGEIVDTNGAWIARQLPEIGIDLHYKSVVGDNLTRLVETFQRALDRSDLVVVTGGLGPTSDDLTREGVAALLGEDPSVDPELEEHLRGMFARRGTKMPEQNLKQAWLIPSAKAINNPRGTAPGWWAERDGTIIVCMPGVPTEMEHMWTFEVRPELARRSGGKVLILRTLKTVGLGESTVDETVRHLYGSPGIGVGTYARADGVHIRIGAKAANEHAARSLISPVEAKMEALLGDAIWGRDGDSFEAYLAENFSKRGLSLAIVDFAAGGHLAGLLADAEQAPSYLRSALIVLAEEDLVRAGVPRTTLTQYGGQSLETAQAAAHAARVVAGTDFGLGITGSFAAGSGSETVPGTIHVAVESEGATKTTATIAANQGRQAVKRRVATTAMMLLRQVLNETADR